MTPGSGLAGMDRREFLRWGSYGGAALVLGLTADERIIAPPSPAGARRFTPSQWIAIDESGTVTIVVARSEMGQGVRTSIPMIVADELGAAWERIRVVQAWPGPDFTQMRTSGSGSVLLAWRGLRPIAAAAREMLVGAAAMAWGVDPATCVTQASGVTHQPTGRRMDFGALAARAASLPVPASPTLKPAGEYRLVGTRVGRTDGPAIVDGTATYGLDVRVPGMRFAAVARAPRLGGVVASVDERRARNLSGVLDIIRVPTGVAVIADRSWTALRARDALEIEWDNAQASADGTRESMRRLEAALERGKLARHDGGDVTGAIEAASRRIEHTYYTAFQAHAAMEPLNCIVHLEGDRCELWAGTQAANQVQEAVAQLLGVEQEQVIVNVPLLGGGFGRRLALDYVLEAVEVARAARVPVQVLWSREDDMRHGMYQPAQVSRLTAGLDAAGRPIAWRHRVADCQLSMYGPVNPDFRPADGRDPWGGFDTPYSIPALEVTLSRLESPVPSCPWRAVTYPGAVFARESFLDEIAHMTGQDPLELRLSLLPSPGTEQVGSRRLPNGDRLRQVLELVAERSGWRGPFARIRGDRRWGRGLACNAYHMQTMVAQVAEVSVGPTGDVRVHRVVCAVDCGQVVNLAGLEAQFEGGVIWALSAALKGEITFDQGRVAQSNFHDFPVIRMNEAPEVEVHVSASDLHAMGAGEQPVPAVAPAVANAIFAATGKRIRRLPIRAADLT